MSDEVDRELCGPSSIPGAEFLGVADEPEEFGHLQSIIEMDDLEESINQLHQQSF
jgi:hypothetical protein